MVKPSIFYQQGNDPYEMVVKSLQKGPKRRIDIFRDIESPIRERLSSSSDLSKVQIEKQVKRDTLRPRTISSILKNLKKWGYVLPPDKLGFYMLTEKVFENPSYVIPLFVRQTFQPLLTQGPLLMASAEWPDQTAVDNITIRQYSSLLSEFSRLTGIYFIYLFMTALDPDGPLRPRRKGRVLTGPESDREIGGLASKLAGECMPHLFSLLKRSLAGRGLQLSGSVNNRRFQQLKKGEILDLQKIFKVLYPSEHELLTSRGNMKRLQGIIRALQTERSYPSKNRKCPECGGQGVIYIDKRRKRRGYHLCSLCGLYQQNREFVQSAKKGK